MSISNEPFLVFQKYSSDFGKVTLQYAYCNNVFEVVNT